MAGRGPGAPHPPRPCAGDGGPRGATWGPAQASEDPRAEPPAAPGTRTPRIFAPRDARAQARGARRLRGDGRAASGVGRPPRCAPARGGPPGTKRPLPVRGHRLSPCPAAPLSRRERRSCRAGAPSDAAQAGPRGGSWSWETAGTAPAALGERGAYRAAAAPPQRLEFTQRSRKNVKKSHCPGAQGPPAALPLPAALALQRAEWLRGEGRGEEKGWGREGGRRRGGSRREGGGKGRDAGPGVLSLWSPGSRCLRLSCPEGKG